jgi:hypothetical protein
MTATLTRSTPAWPAPPPTAAASFRLIENAQARSEIVVTANAAEPERRAANELQQYLHQISGATVPISERATAGTFSILLGQAASTPLLLEAIKAIGDDSASFVLQADGGGVRIVGLSPEGTANGVTELLEQLGVRWFMPGEIGTVIPHRKTVTVRAQRTVQVPSFAGRWMNAGMSYAEWGKHLRMGGPFFPSAHGIPGLKDKKLVEAHPEYFALVSGKRTPSQVCVSNPAVIATAIAETKKFFRDNPHAAWIGMGPNDGSGFCECEKCRMLDGGDFDAFSSELSVTDRYIWFFNQVLDGIADEFPEKKIGFYAYHTYMRTPVKTKPHPHIVPAFAPIGLCRIHGMNNPICPERSYYKTLMEDWGKLMPEIYERGYWFNLADPGFPFSLVHRLREEIPFAHDKGIKGWRTETIDHWGSETPSLYVAAKLMWNHNADVDALLNDFYEKFFGPAQKPMKEYFTLMDAALRDADYHTGSSFDMPHLYPQKLRDTARRKLRHAAQLAGDGDYAERVGIFRGTFDYLETFIAMLENQNSQNFVAAQKCLERLDAQQKSLMAHTPPLISPRGGPNFLKRFFRQPVAQGFARVQSADGQILPLRDEWQFQLDPQKIGEDIGLWRPHAIGNNWQTLKTSTKSWGDQGLRYYKGEAWYRQEIALPPSFVGKRVFLWFGGVDEKAKVWVNGQMVGISHGVSFLPFEFDVTSALKPGVRNVVAVRLLNKVVDELGTGGITAPTMFYVAAPDAKPDNVRQLSPTFP